MSTTITQVKNTDPQTLQLKPDVEKKENISSKPQQPTFSQLLNRQVSKGFQFMEENKRAIGYTLLALGTIAAVYALPHILNAYAQDPEQAIVNMRLENLSKVEPGINTNEMCPALPFSIVEQKMQFLDKTPAFFPDSIEYYTQSTLPNHPLAETMEKIMKWFTPVYSNSASTPDAATSAETVLPKWFTEAPAIPCTPEEEIFYKTGEYFSNSMEGFAGFLSKIPSKAYEMLPSLPKTTREDEILFMSRKPYEPYFLQGISKVSKRWFG